MDDSRWRAARTACALVCAVFLVAAGGAAAAAGQPAASPAITSPAAGGPLNNDRSFEPSPVTCGFDPADNKPFAFGAGLTGTAEPATSMSLPAGSASYFYVGSDAGGNPLTSISWHPDLSVTAAYSGNEAVSVGRSTSGSASFGSGGTTNVAIAGVGVSGYRVTGIPVTASTSTGTSVTLRAATAAGDLLLVVAGGEGAGLLQQGGSTSLHTLLNVTYSECGSDVIASAGMFAAFTPAGAATITVSGTTYPANSGTSVGAVGYLLAPEAGQAPPSPGTPAPSASAGVPGQSQCPAAPASPLRPSPLSSSYPLAPAPDVRELALSGYPLQTGLAASQAYSYCLVAFAFNPSTGPLPGQEITVTATGPSGQAAHARTLTTSDTGVVTLSLCTDGDVPSASGQCPADLSATSVVSAAFGTGPDVAVVTLSTDPAGVSQCPLDLSRQQNQDPGFKCVQGIDAIGLAASSPGQPTVASVLGGTLAGASQGQRDCLSPYMAADITTNACSGLYGQAGMNVVPFSGSPSSEIACGLAGFAQEAIGAAECAGTVLLIAGGCTLGGTTGPGDMAVCPVWYGIVTATLGTDCVESLLGVLRDMFAGNQIPSLAQGAVTASSSADVAALGVDAACAMIAEVVTASEDEIPSQGTGTVTFTIEVRNGLGDPVSGAPVWLEASGTGDFSAGSGPPGPIGASPAEVTTDSAGKVTVSFTYPPLPAVTATLTASDVPENALGSAYYASTATIAWERFPPDTSCGATGKPSGYDVTICDLGAASPGETLTVTPAGYAPGTIASITLQSAGISLGRVVMPGSGIARIPVPIPKTIAAGRHLPQAVPARWSRRITEFDGVEPGTGGRTSRPLRPRPRVTAAAGRPVPT